MSKPVVRIEVDALSVDEGSYQMSFALDDETWKANLYWTPGSVGRCRAMMIARAAEHRRQAEEHAAKAAAYEAGAAESAKLFSAQALLDDTRDQVLGRLGWCEYFFGREHQRDDVWPEDRREEFERVREIVTGCTDLDALVRWSVICERMAAGWVDALAADVGSSVEPVKLGCDPETGEPTFIPGDPATGRRWQWIIKDEELLEPEQD